MTFQTQKETASVKRSSAMSFAIRWKHENKKWWLITCFSLIAVSLLFFILLHGTDSKSVTLTIDGVQKQVQTKEATVQGLLEEQSVKLGEHDVVSLPLNAELEHKSVIEIETAKAVQVTSSGKTETKYTTADTVGEALQDLDIAFDADDKIFPDASNPVKEQLKITVVQVETKVEEVQHAIPFQTVKKEDNSLLKGKEQLVQEGQEGVLVSKVETTIADGKVVSKKMVEKNVLQEPVEEVVAVGTKNPVAILSASSPSVDEVTIDGVTFDYKKVLTDVELTAYDAGAGSTGKSEGDPGYGITYSGTKVQEGRTVSVDPKVIPIGWWIYIEGLGFRKAEDTGSAVKGNHIDVYMESTSEAKQFGRKKGYTVYVIGPNKPS
ncbi:ubiquitin-like domain-containing protein [Marinicrinis lubricantis]|uniref:Ubiquitin-like domain-containing protein n=1 Tax=Marinicrinis lubricantis TaxID=2086470 RepID=A0ABW1IQE8_9BACL